jgi:hypothetical protein
VSGVRRTGSSPVPPISPAFPYTPLSCLIKPFLAAGSIRHSERVVFPGVWNKAVVVAGENDEATMLNHALIQAGGDTGGSAGRVASYGSSSIRRLRLRIPVADEVHRDES